MSRYIRQLLLKPYALQLLEDAAPSRLRLAHVRNTTFYYEAAQDPETADGLARVRISYRYYTPRFPDLHSRDQPPSMQIHYDESSIHYKELHFFDDMIRKINEEKEIWPGVKLQDPAHQKKE